MGPAAAVKANMKKQKAAYEGTVAMRVTLAPIKRIETAMVSDRFKTRMMKPPVKHPKQYPAA